VVHETPIIYLKLSFGTIIARYTGARGNMLNWYALYVKSNHEFVARAELLKKRIETFLPTTRKLRHWKDRKKEIDFPIFPGYLFVYVRPSQEDFVAALKTRGVISILSAQAGHPTPIAPEEISSLKLMVESGQDIDIYPHLKEGTRVRVKRGPLQGAEGTLERKDGQYTFLVNIELLGRSIGVKIYADHVEEA
jgi:transcriptional antiterminator NusG